MALWRKFFHLQLDSEDVTGGTSSASSFFQTGSLRLDIHKVNRPLRISGSCGRTSHKTERAANGVHTLINARDMHTQCESVPMEASRTAASRLINV